jgi:hypothetical protein
MAARFTRGICGISWSKSFAALAPLVALVSLTMLGCRKTPEPPAGASESGSSTGLQPSPGPKAESAPPMPSSTPPVEITWVDPPSFKRVPPKNAMRKASYEVPHAAGDSEDGELAVFYFGPGEGGGIEQNVTRWVKQFSGIQAEEVKRADREANGLREHTVEIVRGTFESGMPGMGPSGPKKDYALEGAIIEAPSGAYFFKMTGPAKTVAAARAAFMQLLDSVRPG